MVGHQMRNHQLRDFGFSWLMVLLVILHLRADQPKEEELYRMAFDGIEISPSTTDPRIRDFNLPHRTYVNQAIVVEHKP